MHLTKKIAVKVLITNVMAMTMIMGVDSMRMLSNVYIIYVERSDSGAELQTLD